MATFDQMIIDDRDLANRYFGDNSLGDIDDDRYSYAQHSTHDRQPPKPAPRRESSGKGNDNDGLFGRRVFLESPSLGNKEEEDMYRYVPSRLSDHTASIVGAAPPVSVPVRTGETLIDSLDFELDLIGATNNHHTAPNYRGNTQVLRDAKPPAPLTQMPNPMLQSPRTTMRGVDPRQDPLLGPLLAELDAMSTQQQTMNYQQQRPQPPPPPPPTVFRRNSMPYEPNLVRPPVQSQSNHHTLASTANRTVTDALLEAELYDSLDPHNDQQLPPLPNIQQRKPVPYSAPNVNSSQFPPPQQYQRQPSRTTNMNGTDIFVPSAYDSGPEPFLNHFGPEDQLFQRPLLNALGQNYVPRTRPQPPPPQRQQQNELRDPTFDNSYTRMSPPLRTSYAPTSNNGNEYQQQQQQQQSYPNRQPQFENEADPFAEYHDMYAPQSQYQRQPPPPPQQQRMMPPLPPPPQQHPRPPPQHHQQQQQQLHQYQQQPPPQQQQQQQQHYYEGQMPSNSYPSNEQEMFFTDNGDEQLEQMSHRQQQHPPPMMSQRGNDQQEQDSKRQAIWNELQRTNAKVQEKNAKKRESANRRNDFRLKGTFGTNNNSQQSSAQSKAGQRSPPHPPPPPKNNYIDENIDMIKNKENFYHRYPAKKYEHLYSKRKDLSGGGNGNQNQDKKRDGRMDSDHPSQTSSTSNVVATYSDPQHRSSLPVTINLNPGEKSESGSLPATVTIPLDSHVNRVGDKISVNIDLRLVDLQNLKQQQQQQGSDRPDWSGLDPLDRHIRKMERSIDESLPQTHPPQQRSPVPHTGSGGMMGRYGKLTTGAGSGGYNPPTYSGEYYGYGDKSQKEDSYLAKMNQTKKGPQFKPYTGRDYEKFKKNYGFGTGYLGFDFDNAAYKERSDKLAKTKEYAQQIEAMNKKKLAEAPRRTLSDTRLPTEASRTQRALEYARVSTRNKPPSGTSTRSTPPNLNSTVPMIPARRPTEVLHRPPPAQRQATRAPQNGDNELVERLTMRHERDKAQVQDAMHRSPPTVKRREQMFDDDDQRSTNIERLAQDRANNRRQSPPRQAPPGPAGGGRRPLRFDKPLLPNEPNHPPSQQYRPVQQHHPPARPAQQQHYQEPQVNDLAQRHHDEKMLMDAIRQELSERPLGEDEELIVVEQ